MLSLYSGRLLRGVAVAAVATAAISVGYVAELYPEAIQRRITEALNPTEASDLIARMQVVRELTGAIEESGGLGIGIAQSERYLREHHSTAQSLQSTTSCCTPLWKGASSPPPRYCCCLWRLSDCGARRRDGRSADGRRFSSAGRSRFSWPSTPAPSSRRRWTSTRSTRSSRPWPRAPCTWTHMPAAARCTARIAGRQIAAADR